MHNAIWDILTDLTLFFYLSIYPFPLRYAHIHLPPSIFPIHSNQNPKKWKSDDHTKPTHSSSRRRHLHSHLIFHNYYKRQLRIRLQGIDKSRRVGIVLFRYDRRRVLVWGRGRGRGLGLGIVGGRKSLWRRRIGIWFDGFLSLRCYFFFTLFFALSFVRM